MTGARRFLLAVARDEGGSTLTEFAILLVPLLIIMMGGLDIAYHSYVQAIAQGALNDAARRASVEDPVFTASGDTLEERIENTITQQLDNVALDAGYDVQQRSYFDFSDVGNPEKIMTDENGNGQYDADDDDCFEDFNRNGSFDLDGGLEEVGGADDVVFYSVEVTLPHLFQAGLPFSTEDRKFTVSTAIRNQPFRDRATPPILCGV